MALSFSSPKNDVASVLADARWIPSHLGSPPSQLQFFWLPREAQASMSFLADEYLRDAAAPDTWVKVDELEAGVPRDAPPAHYIFHSAFSCSTLLARALDVPGVSIGLREPQILNELAMLHRRGILAEDLLHQVAALLARPFGPDETVVIKPSNLANNLAAQLLQLDSRSRAVFLYAPLPRFLKSMARKGIWGRIWARKLFATIRRESSVNFGFSDAQLFEQTDLQIAAMGWLQQHAHFMSLLSQFPGRILTLDSEAFLAGKEHCLGAIASHFSLAAQPDLWARIAASGVFSKHSKEVGREFLETDGALPADGASAFDDEIDKVVAWIQSLAQHAGIPIPPPKASRIAL